MAEQAKILVAEAEEDNLDDIKFQWWNTCKQCGQKFHGVVAHALGWACWKTYAGRPEVDFLGDNAMCNLGLGLMEVDKHNDARVVFEAQLAQLRHPMILHIPESAILDVQTNLSACYGNLGLNEKALALFREMHAKRMAIYGPEPNTLVAAYNLGSMLIGEGRRAEAIAFLRNQLPHTRRLGPDHEKTLVLRMLYAKALAYIYDDVQMPPPTRDDCREAINILTDVLGRARRVLGPSHPITTRAEDWLQTTRLVVRGLEFRWLVQESM